MAIYFAIARYRLVRVLSINTVGSIFKIIYLQVGLAIDGNWSVRYRLVRPDLSGNYKLVRGLIFPR